MAEQIQFTEDVENAIKEHNLQQIELELMAKLEHYTSIDTNTEDSGTAGMEYGNNTFFNDFQRVSSCLEHSVAII